MLGAPGAPFQDWIAAAQGRVESRAGERRKEKGEDARGTLPAMDLPFDVEDGGESASGNTIASKVLIVDDEAVVRDVLARLLAREADIATTTTETAEAALELLKDEKFDVLITDKNLPGIGGIDLIARARELRPVIEAVMITGYPSAESIIAAMAAGASDYLVKPFDELRLVRAKIRAALERRVERAKGREMSRTIAGQAEALLKSGHDVPEHVWKALENTFTKYEHALRAGGAGKVVVVGGPQAVDLLEKNGIRALHVAQNTAEVALADVVVLEMKGAWHDLADRLNGMSPDLILLGSPHSDLGDLLEAISLRVDLVDATGEGAKALPDRVRAALDRRCIQRAQADVANALAQFRTALTAK